MQGAAGVIDATPKQTSKTASARWTALKRHKRSWEEDDSAEFMPGKDSP